jgi:hypothetical protein
LALIYVEKFGHFANVLDKNILPNLARLPFNLLQKISHSIFFKIKLALSPFNHFSTRKNWLDPSHIDWR